jgi:hypothetical protein
MCVNIYDVRLEDTVPECGMNWPPEMPHITKLLGVRHYPFLPDYQVNISNATLLFFSLSSDPTL